MRLEYGESSKENALKWDQIRSSNFKKFADYSDILPSLRKLHEERIKTDPEFLYIMEDIEDYKEQKEKKIYSLNEEIRKEEWDKAEKRKKERAEAREQLKELELKGGGELEISEGIRDDAFLEESGRILADMIAMTVG